MIYEGLDEFLGFCDINRFSVVSWQGYEISLLSHICPRSSLIYAG